MARSLGTMLAELKLRLDEKSGVRWLDEDLRRWINEGVRDLARQTEWKRSRSSLSVSAGVQSVSLATLDPQVYRIYRVEWQSSGDQRVIPLEWRSMNAMDEFWGDRKEMITGWPSFFTTDGAPPNLSVVLFPKPSLSGSLTVFYYGHARELALDGSEDSVMIDLPDGWEDVVLDYAEYRAFRADGQLDQATLARQEYEMRLAAVREKVQHYTEQPRFYSDYGWWYGTEDWV